MSDDADFVRQAIGDMEEWMAENDCADVVRSLNPGASGDLLRAAEEAVGGALPESLRALYLLHDGQRAEAGCFIESMQLLPISDVLGFEAGKGTFRDDMLEDYFGVSADGIDRSQVICVGEPLKEAEYTDRWFPFANVSLSYLAVNLDTGRVVRAGKGEGIKLEAASLAEFLGDHASRMWDGFYEVVEQRGVKSLRESAVRRERRKFEHDLAQVVSKAELSTMAEARREELFRAWRGDA